VLRQVDKLELFQIFIQYLLEDKHEAGLEKRNTERGQCLLLAAVLCYSSAVVSLNYILFSGTRIP
jgi:hypothetical protein